MRTCVVPNRSALSATDTVQDTPISIDEYYRQSENLCKRYSEKVDFYISLWAKCDEIYYGKERDMKNFPPVKFVFDTPKVRFGFLPDSWFQAFYPKTGVTGPYLFMFGCALSLINKEIWVLDVHFMEFAFFCLWGPLLVKFVGPVSSNFFHQTLEVMEEYRCNGPMREIHHSLDSLVATADEEIAKISAATSLIKAKEENVFLQLEAAYRDRLRLAHRTVQRCLDYHVERENVRRRFQQQHLTNWVVDQVVKGITPAQEKETVAHCISELRRLATMGRATVPI